MSQSDALPTDGPSFDRALPGADNPIWALGRDRAHDAGRRGEVEAAIDSWWRGVGGDRDSYRYFGEDSIDRAMDLAGAAYALRLAAITAQDEGRRPEAAAHLLTAADRFGSAMGMARGDAEPKFNLLGGGPAEFLALALGAVEAARGADHAGVAMARSALADLLRDSGLMGRRVHAVRTPVLVELADVAEVLALQIEWFSDGEEAR